MFAIVGHTYPDENLIVEKVEVVAQVETGNEDENGINGKELICAIKNQYGDYAITRSSAYLSSPNTVTYIGARDNKQLAEILRNLADKLESGE